MNAEVEAKVKYAEEWRWDLSLVSEIVPNKIFPSRVLASARAQAHGECGIRIG